MVESPSVDSVAKALGYIGRVLGGIKVGHLVAEPTLLVLLGGETMRSPSVARRRLAVQVRELLLFTIDEMEPVEDRLTAKVMLATDDELHGKNIEERVAVYYANGTGKLTQASFDKRRPHVLKRLAEYLVSELQDFDPDTESDDEDAVEPYDEATDEILSELVWHAQELACYLLAFRMIVVNAYMVHRSDRASFVSWKAKYHSSDGAAALSLYEYCRIGELIWDLQQLSDGRRFLRENGLDHLVHPAFYTEYFVPFGTARRADSWSDEDVATLGQPLDGGVSVHGPFGDRSEFFDRIETDRDLRTALEQWNDELTNGLATEWMPTDNFEIGDPSTFYVTVGVVDLLTALADVVLNHFATVEAMQYRGRLVNGLVRDGGVFSSHGMPGAVAAVPQDLAGWLDQSLWSAVTLRRFLDSDDAAFANVLPVQPGRVSHDPASLSDGIA